jgi:predicted O-linked N-acetylglucosamine transferase (SPINDLY family)
MARRRKKRGQDARQTGGSVSIDEKVNTSVLAHQAGRLAEAKQLYEEILSQDPNNITALHLLGVLRYQEGDARRAIELIEKALILKPDHAGAHNNLGIVLDEQGNLDEAVAAYQVALKLAPDYAEAHYNLGIALKSQGKLEEAVASYLRALRLKPDHTGAHNNLGIVLEDQGKLEEAVASYRKALKIEPDYSEAHSNLGIALRDQGKLEEAVAAYRMALKLRPGFAEAHCNLGKALRDQGKLEESVAAYRMALELKPDFAEAHSNLIFTLNFDARISQQEIFAESRRWDEIHAVRHRGRERIPANSRDPDRLLRVGYLSADFREHSVNYFVAPIIAGHDRRLFEVFCYAEVVNPDGKTAKIRDLADGWRSTVGMSDSAVAKRIREDGIDILVDLAGHTANNRLLVFAERPAPVQVTWLGYPNTTGLSAIDYRLTDDVADPEGTADSLHSERLERLPSGFLCFAPTADAPGTGESPASASGHVTFGSFNALSKVTPQVVETWAHILERVPRSRLLIKSRPLADEGTRIRFLEMFVALGIDAGRVELCSWIASKTGHLGAYGRVDIGLDPYPYNGTTTTCEALWMGVPIVTLRGNRHSGRVGASILTRVGLTELITDTVDGYMSAAVALAESPDRIAEYRRELRAATAASPLCDAARFTDDVEAAYRKMWRRWCQSA